MTEGNTPAFAAMTATTLGDVEYQMGLTKREYFAAKAPAVPDWFIHKQPIKPQRPQFNGTPDDDKLIRNWHNDGFEDLPDHLQWYADEWIKYQDERQMWEKENQKARFFQWSTYYADALIEQLNK